MRFWILGGVLLLVGCEESELDAMRRVGDKAIEKVAGLAQQAQSKVNLPLPPTPPPAEIRPAALAAADRAQRRLDWDQALAGLNLQIVSAGKGLALRGEVRTSAQHKRALDLARSTVGVGEIDDQLSLSSQNDD